MKIKENTKEYLIWSCKTKCVMITEPEDKYENYQGKVENNDNKHNKTS